MTKLNLLEARTLANELLANRYPAVITQLSEHRFEVDAPAGFQPKRFKEKFVFNQGWLLEKANTRTLKSVGAIVAATACITVVLLLFVREGNPVSSDLKTQTLTQESIEVLVATGRTRDGQTTFVESKRIELGGYLTLLVNATSAEKTRLVRLDLIQTQNRWEIEKWVELD